MRNRGACHTKGTGTSGGAAVYANAKRSSEAIRWAVMGGLLTALVFVATMFINLRLPIASNGGLVHLGNVPLMLGAALYGRRMGAVCGAFGMALFDLVSGWAAWAPFTFVIVGLMGYAMGSIACHAGRTRILRLVVAVAVATVIKIAGYYAAEVILYGNWVVPIASIPGNLVQMGVAAAIALPAMRILHPLARTM